MHHAIQELERFSTEYRTTKTKVITRPITTDVNSEMNKSEFRANTCNRRQARENACERVTIGFGFASQWLRKRCESQSVIKQNQGKSELLSILN